MCRSAKEIRRSDYTCITLDRFIAKRSEEAENGTKDFDILQAEAQIENRVTTIQTQEDMEKRFDKVDGKLEDVTSQIDCLEGQLTSHVEEGKENPTMVEKKSEEPWEFWRNISLVLVGYYLFFQFMYEVFGVDGIMQVIGKTVASFFGFKLP